MLVRIIKGWKGPDFFYQTPGEKGIWDGIQFTFAEVEECDFVIMLNNQMKRDSYVKCPRENIWAIMQEPYEKGHSDWMVEKHDAYAKVLTNYIPSNHQRYLKSHPADPWHVQKNYDELVTANLPDKIHHISWIAGNATDLPGHHKRTKLLNYVMQNEKTGIHFFGRAVKYIEDKWDGLAPYKYTVIIQNSSSPDYWTDVVSDSFLSWTVPIYFGCTNLEEYFPQDSFIKIDSIDDPSRCLDLITSVIKNDDWEKRLPSIERSRQLVLNKYQFFPHLTSHIKAFYKEGLPKEDFILPAYKRSMRARISRIEYKIRKKLGFNFG